MTDANFAILIDFAAGGLMLAAVLVVWRRDLRAIVRLLAWQGVALAAIPLLRGIHDGETADPEPRMASCAGRGSRLGSLTDDRPKCMVELGGRPLIDWQVSALRAAGVTEVAVVRGYLGHRIIAPGASFYNPRWAQSNMVASLYCAQPWIGSGPVIVASTAETQLLSGQGSM